MDLNIGKDEEDAEEEQSPLAYFKLFNDKFKRVELLAKHLLAIPVPLNFYLAMLANQ